MTWIVSYQFRSFGRTRNRRTRWDSLQEAQDKVERLKDGAKFLYGDSGFSNIRILIEETATRVLEHHGIALGPEYEGDLDKDWATTQLTSSGDGPIVLGEVTTVRKLRSTSNATVCYRCYGLLGERHDTECSQYRSWGREFVTEEDTWSMVDYNLKRRTMTAGTEIE